MSHLSTMNWVDVEEKLARTDLGLIPVGAVEVYGPHMPQGTDGIVAEALCGKVAKSVEVLGRSADSCWLLVHATELSGNIERTGLGGKGILQRCC